MTREPRPMQPCACPSIQPSLLSLFSPEDTSAPQAGIPLYDAALKKIFSHRLMIELLVRRHIPEFADRIDFTSLETLNTELIGKGFVKRYADMLLRADLSDEDGALVLSIEFQDRPERNMAFRTTMYNLLVAQTLLDDDRKHGRARRKLAIRSLVLHHGGGPWNAPTRLADLFVESAPDTYKVVSRKSAAGSPPVPLDLPEMVLRLGHNWTPEVLSLELPRLWRVIEELGDEHFDQFMAETLKEVLISEGYSSRQLEEAMTMGTVKTAFQRGLEDIDQQGFRRGRREGREEGRARLLHRQVTRRFGPETAGELARLLTHRTDPDLVARAADAILDCASAEEFLASVRQGGGLPPGVPEAQP